MAKTEIKTDICVVGGGLAGLTAGIKLAEQGAHVTICAAKPMREDKRTTALLMKSIDFFRELGLWQSLEEKSFPLKTMRIVDGTNRLIRAPQTDFHAAEIDLEAFGYNLRNRDMLDAFTSRIAATSNIEILEGLVTTVESKEGQEIVNLSSSDSQIVITAGFVVGADGRDSIVRRQKQVSVRDWQYPQEAIVLDFDHERSTQFTSTEFHTEAGPFTIVPHSHKSAGLVWMEKPETVAKLLSQSKEEFEQTIEQKMQSYLGKITLRSTPQSYPMKGLVANTFGEENYALIGEAAHVFPPIGAQGFNLGIRDTEALAKVMTRYTNQENRGSQYNRARKLDVNTRTYGVDLLNRSLISEFFPAQVARGVGLHMLGSIPPLRKYVMKMGISPTL